MSLYQAINIQYPGIRFNICIMIPIKSNPEYGSSNPLMTPVIIVLW